MNELLLWDLNMFASCILHMSNIFSSLSRLFHTFETIRKISLNFGLDWTRLEHFPVDELDHTHWLH